MPPRGKAPVRSTSTSTATRMLDRLHRLAGPGGRVRFDVYVDAALYTPGLGYYERAGRRLGRAGDFYTAPHVHPIFGRTLSRRVLAEWERMGQPCRLQVVELGPGDGTLAVDLLSVLGKSPAGFTSLSYAYVERSTALRQRLEERLTKGRFSPKVHTESWPSIGHQGVFDGIVLANEFFDAQPFRRFVIRGGAWREIWVRIEGERLRIEELPVEGFAPLPPPGVEGSEFELAEGWGGILRAVADHLVRGTLLVLDYGDEEENLLARPGGTAAAFRLHHTVGDPLASPGEVDLSAFVNFTRLRSSARSAGLSEVGYDSQAEALGAWGIREELESIAPPQSSSPDSVKARLAVKNLLFGFPNFRVVELVPADAPKRESQLPTG